MRSDTPLSIACATDDGYAPHCGTMLHSVLSHNAPASTRVHLLHGGTLSSENRERMQRLVTGMGSSLDFLKIAPSQLQGFPATQFHIACWYRVLLPQLLPEASRVLYLDADMVVMDDLDELWNIDLQDKLFGAVINPLYPFMPDRVRGLGLAGPADYLNSGVLLMDLDRMREGRVTEHLREYARRHPDNAWPEQDALSVVCRDQWQPLPPRWNAQSTLFDLRAGRLPFARDQIADARRRPAIVHFIGPLKPWHYLCRHPFRHAYVEHRGQTPWAAFELEGRTWRNRILRPLSLGMQVRVRSVYRKLVGPWRAPRLRGPRVMDVFARHYPEATFLQIGSNDGAKHDPLRAAFLKSRWTGVMVEPVPYVFERLRANYGLTPRVRLENVAVAAQPGTLPFYYVAQAEDAETLPRWYDELGSFRRDVVLKHADQIPDLERRIVATQVTCVTLPELCRRNGVSKIDLIHTDLEGYDYELIKSIDLREIRPVLLVYEHKHLEEPDRLRCQQDLRNAGYALFEESADTWCIDTRTRDARHRRLLRAWRRIAAGAQTT